MNKSLFFVVVVLVASCYCAVPDCNTFCGTANTTCGAAGLGYVSVAGCVQWCNIMVGANFTGDTTNQTGNSIGCRQYWANQIAGNASLATNYCQALSITGGNRCGGTANDTCAVYCALEAFACNDTYSIGGAAPFSALICGLGCAGVMGQGGFNHSGSAFPIATSGNTAQCRTYHVQVASLQAANSPERVQHCSHASPSGGLACGDATSARTDFCTNLYLICGAYSQSQGGPNRFPYSSIQQCVTDAQSYSTADLGVQYGPVNASTGDSLGCRIYHGGYPSFVDGATHCPHAGFSSAPCGNRPTTAAPTTVAPSTAAPSTAGALGLTVLFSVVMSIAAFLF